MDRLINLELQDSGLTNLVVGEDFFSQIYSILTHHRLVLFYHSATLEMK